MSKIEKGSMNVYADLGTAAAEEMLVKAQLATKIGEIIKLRKLTQTQAAALLGMPQPKLSNMLRGRFRGISEAKMLECLTLLGRDVQIVVMTASRSRKTGSAFRAFCLTQESFDEMNLLETEKRLIIRALTNTDWN